MENTANGHKQHQQPSLRKKQSFVSPPPNPQIKPGPNAFAKKQVSIPGASSVPNVPALVPKDSDTQHQVPTMSPPYQQRTFDQTTTTWKAPSSSDKRHSNTTPSPPFRSSHDEKKEDRLFELIKNGGVSATTQIANIHNRFRPNSPSRSAAIKVDNTDASHDHPTSPKKTFFNKLGFGTAPLLRPDISASSPLTEPSKTDVTPIRVVPYKAAKILGTDPPADRDSATASANKRISDSEKRELYAETNHSVLTSTSLTGSPRGRKQKTLQTSEATHNQIEQPESGHTMSASQEPRLRALNERIASGASQVAGKSPVKFLDDDNPPTPPSKSSLERLPQHHGNGHDKRQEERGHPDATPTRAPRGEELVKVGDMEQNNHLNVVSGHAHPRSMYGAIGHVKTPQRLPKNDPQDQNSNLVAPHTSLATPRSPAHLPSTTYTPSVYQDMWSPTKNVPVFSNSLDRPGPTDGTNHAGLFPSPLHIAPQMRLANDQLDGSPRARNTSESTGMSVPVYLEREANGTGNGSYRSSTEDTGRQHRSPRHQKDNHESVGTNVTIRGPTESIMTWEVVHRLEARIDANFKALHAALSERVGRLEECAQSMNKTQTMLWDSHTSTREMFAGMHAEIEHLRYLVMDQNRKLREVLDYMPGPQTRPSMQQSQHSPNPNGVHTSPNRFPPAYTPTGLRPPMPADPADLAEQTESSQTQNPFQQRDRLPHSTQAPFFSESNRSRMGPDVWSHPYYRNNH